LVAWVRRSAGKRQPHGCIQISAQHVVDEPFNGSNRGEVRAGVLRGGGTALANACRTVRRYT
jgi:hypothetical protein